MNYKDTSVGFGANVGASIEKGLASATHITVAQAEQPPAGDTVIVNPDGSTVELTEEQKAALKARQGTDAAAAAQPEPTKPASEVAKKDEPAPAKSGDDVPWYNTTWGKVGICVGIFAFGAAVGYGAACLADTSAD